jgi:hypothetical protein
MWLFYNAKVNEGNTETCLKEAICHCLFRDYNTHTSEFYQNTAHFSTIFIKINSYVNSTENQLKWVKIYKELLKGFNQNY